MHQDAQSGRPEVSRRVFLRVLAGTGAGIAAAAAVTAEAGAQAAAPTHEHAAPTDAAPRTRPPHRDTRADSAPHQWAMVIDLRKCDGCEKCSKACQKTHMLGKDQKWLNVYKLTNPAGQTSFMPRLCMQCENPPCTRVCPVGATYKNPEGIVLVDQNVCIGCRTCMAACPYEARYFNWEEPPPAPSLLQQPMPEFPVPQQRGTVGKCILCVHYTQFGKLPACAEACTMEAIYVGDLVTDVATNGRETVKLSKFIRENDAVRFKEELGTRPRIYYILGHGQLLDF